MASMARRPNVLLGATYLPRWRFHLYTNTKMLTSTTFQLGEPAGWASDRTRPDQTTNDTSGVGSPETRRAP